MLKDGNANAVVAYCANIFPVLVTNYPWVVKASYTIWPSVTIPLQSACMLAEQVKSVNHMQACRSMQLDQHAKYYAESHADSWDWRSRLQKPGNLW